MPPPISPIVVPRGCCGPNGRCAQGGLRARKVARSSNVTALTDAITTTNVARREDGWCFSPSRSLRQHCLHILLRVANIGKMRAEECDMRSLNAQAFL